MKQIKQVTIILAFWLAGEGLTEWTGISIPGSIIGMLLIVAALELKLIKPIHIEEVAQFLIHNMALFFIPAGTGLMCYLDIIRSEWIPIVASMIISTLLVMSVTALILNSKRKSNE